MDFFIFLKENLLPVGMLAIFTIYLIYSLASQGKNITIGNWFSVKDSKSEDNKSDNKTNIAQEESKFIPRDEFINKMSQVVISLISFLTLKQQKQYEKIKILRDDTLKTQLDYVDRKFLMNKTELENIILPSEMVKDGIEGERQTFALHNFEEVYNKVNEHFINIVKKNHFAQTSEEDLQEKIDSEAKISINYLKERVGRITIDFDRQKFIIRYTEIVNEISKSIMIHAKNLAVERNKQIKEIKEQYKTETIDYIDSVLKKNGVKIIEEEIKNIIDKNIDFSSDL